MYLKPLKIRGLSCPVSGCFRANSRLIFRRRDIRQQDFSIQATFFNPSDRPNFAPITDFYPVRVINSLARASRPAPT
jgi:hypothetical protein